MDWQPTASLQNLQLRAGLLKKVREFFEKRHVLEVETPLVCYAGATDPQLANFETNFISPGSHSGARYFLQTSPEFAMKRLLAAGYGSIYQICKAFRNGEIGKKHNPEFTILEWYRIGFTHQALMDEMDSFLAAMLNTKQADRISYSQLFWEYFSVNPHNCSLKSLQAIAQKFGIIFKNNDNSEHKDIWLDLLLTHIIEPELGQSRPVYIYDYPATQAALAKVRQEEDYLVGERFEVYYKGIELANGYHELSDAHEQLERCRYDNRVRQLSNLPVIPIDMRLLAALPSLPNCAGVALGFDRLVYLAANVQTLSEVMAFSIRSA